MSPDLEGSRAHDWSTVEAGTDFPQCLIGGSSNHAGKPEGASGGEAGSTSVEHTGGLHSQDYEGPLFQGWKRLCKRDPPLPHTHLSTASLF